jgi:hypothetical protein
VGFEYNELRRRALLARFMTVVFRTGLQACDNYDVLLDLCVCVCVCL